MKRLLLALGLLIGLASPALAQNTTCSDRPSTDSSNACANTRFVQTNGTGGINYCPAADATGVADSTAALQACISASKYVQLRVGTYKITDALIPIDNQVIALSPGVTIRQYTVDKNVFRSVNGTNQWIEGNGGRLYGFGVFCGNVGQPVTPACPSGQAQVYEDIGVYQINCTNCGVRNLKTVNFATAGIVFRGGAGPYWGINNTIEGTNNYTTPVTSQANYEYGYYVYDEAGFGVTTNVHIIGGDVSGVAQGMFVGSDPALSYANRGVTVDGIRFHDIPGQHATYNTSQGINYTNITCTNVELACIKFQIINGDMTGFSAIGILADNVRGNWFEIAVLAGTPSIMSNVKLQGVGKTLNRAIAINAEAGNTIRNLDVDLVASTVSDIGVYVLGDTVNANIKATLKDVASDCVYITATAATIRLTPTLRECNTANAANQSGIRLNSASGSVALDLINPSVTDSNTRMRYGLWTNAFSTTKVIGSAVFTGAQVYGVRSDGPLTQWPQAWSVSGSTGDFTGTNTIGSAIGPSSTLYLGSGASVNWNSDVQIRHSPNILLFENAASGYRFDAAIVPTTSGLTSVGSAGIGWSALVLENGAGQRLSIVPPASGTPIWTPGSASGTPAVTASSPLVITAGTGNLTCPTCATSSGGGAITGTAPITVSAGGVVSLDDAGVTFAKIQNLNALSVIGRSANTSGVSANISATAATDSVLRESGSTIGFGTIATAGIANNAVTLAKLATQPTNTALVNATSGTAVPTAQSISSCSTAASALIWTTNTGFGCNTAIAASTVTTNANLTGAVTSVGNATSLGSFSSANLLTALTDETGSGVAVFGTSPTLSTVDARGTWTTGTSWTLPAFTLGGTVSGGGNQINNVIVGTSTPLAGSFTTLTASTSVSSPIHAASSALQFQSNGTTFAGNIDTSQKWILGTNTTASGSVLTVTKNTGTLPAVGAFAPLIQVGQADASQTTMILQSFASGGSQPAVVYGKARGTAASPTQIISGDFLFSNFGFGYTTSGSTGYLTNAGLGFIGVATENYTSTAAGARLDFYATPDTTATVARAASVGAGFMVGTTTDPGAGGLTATGAAINLTGLASDTATVDNTVCVSGTGRLLKGSGALGVCLGTSGRQFKTAFEPMKVGLKEIVALKLSNYRYKDGYGDNGEHIQYGPTAQDVEDVIPDLVRYNEKGEAINYDWPALLFASLKSIQELKADNDNLRAAIEDLQSKGKANAK